MLKNRRGFVLSLAAGIAAMTFVGASVLADELFGVLCKVDVEGKTITIITKDSDKPIDVKVDDATEVVTKKGSVKLDLEKVEKAVEKAREKGRKGVAVKVTHDKGVASKITYERKKKDADKAK